MRAFLSRFDFLLFAITLLGLAAGAGFTAFDVPLYASISFASGTALVLIALIVIIIRSLARGAVGLDIVAALSMAGSLALGEWVAGNVVALMFAGGQVLEAYAQARARKDMTALISRAPRRAQIYRGREIEEIAVEAIQPGDLLMIRPGDVLPVDGQLSSDDALFDESVMTGEAAPVHHQKGDALLSGITNIGGAIDLVATTDVRASAFAAIIRMVEDAEAQKAPMARLADRHAISFLVFTIMLAAFAFLYSGDPVRALAVFVVATPCPLILAVPVAIVAGLSRAAKQGVLVKHGGALETLAETKTILFDKTGTLTRGEPVLRDVVVAPGFDRRDVIRAAGALCQGSTHVVSAALARAAALECGALPVPSAVIESAGEGVSGVVEGKRIAVGTFPFVSRMGSPEGWHPVARDLVASETGLIAAIGIEGAMIGFARFVDAVRPEAAEVFQDLRALSISRTVLLTGDRREVAEEIGRGLSLNQIIAEATPAGKVEAVIREKSRAVTAMVGDGVNDAPALAAADVGIALGVRGAGAPAEAADIVLLVDRLDALPEAILIARRSFSIARQSVYAGLAFSALGMIFAAFGYLQPVKGAILQEFIDVAVILNALRALSDKKTVTIQH
ncbi:MAG: heavy metal translocating P-type ATPase [Alphaproteobacteria bacterium]